MVIQSSVSINYSISFYLQNIISWILFFRLDPDTKNSEILRLLPLLTPFASDFVGLRAKIDKAFSQLEDIENAKKNLIHNNNNNNNINNVINTINNNSVFPCHADDTSSYSYSSKLSNIQSRSPQKFLVSII